MKPTSFSFARALAQLEQTVRLRYRLAEGQVLSQAAHDSLLATWSIVHGFAHLLLDGKLSHMNDGATPTSCWTRCCRGCCSASGLTAPFVHELEMEDLADDLPAAVQANERQEVGEALGRDGAFHLGEGRHIPSELDRQDAVGARMPLRLRRRALVHDGKVPRHVEVQQLASRGAEVVGIGVEGLAQAPRVALVQPIEVGVQGQGHALEIRCGAHARRARKSFTGKPPTPQLSSSTSSMTTWVMSGSLPSTRVSSSVTPAISSVFWARVTSSRVTWMFT
nr:Csw016 [uncultured bacterium]